MASPHESCLRHEVIEEKINAEHRRLDKHAEQIDEIRDNLAKATACIADMSRIDARIIKLDERIEAIESKPGKKWEQVTMYACTVLAGAVIGFLFESVVL